MRLKNLYFKMVQDALLDAFSYPHSLRSMVRITLDVNPANIMAQTGTLANQVGELLDWAQDHDQIEELIKGAQSENPGNKMLEDAAAKFFNNLDDVYVIRDLSNDQSQTGNEKRDEQYEIASNWDGIQPMREFDLSERDLSRKRLSSGKMQRANLQRANLSTTDLRATNLDGAILSGASLIGASMYSTQLYRSILIGANLSRATMQEANLCYATLHMAKLRETDMKNARLRGADLCEADLHGTRLSWADLSNAILAEATNLDKAELRGARYNEQTSWPDGFDPKAAGAILVDDEGYPILTT